MGARILLSRSVCSYKLVSCRGVAWHRLKAYAQLQVRQLAIYLDTGAFALCQGDSLHIWMWDAHALSLALKANGIAENAPVIPESALLLSKANGETRSTSAHLFHSGSGFEGLITDSGSIQHNHWWPTLPNAEDWQRFCADNTTLPRAATYSVPSPLTRDFSQRLAGRGWSVKQPTNASLGQKKVAGGSGLWLGIATGTCFAAGLGFASYLAVTDWKLRQIESALQSDQSQLKTITLRKLKARDDAQKAFSKATELAAFDQTSSPVELWEAWADKFVLLGVTVKEFELRSGQIRMLIASNYGRLDPTTVMDIVSKHPQISDVRIDLNAAMAEMRISAAWLSLANKEQKKLQ
jgi:hypothetical protein